MNIPIASRMNAIQLDEPNGKLTLRQVSVPLPRKGQVVVRIAAAPINPSDLGSLSGASYSGVRNFPFTPGIEGSGTVIAAGQGFLPGLLNGRRVACSPISGGNGTWAEYMLTSAQLCTPLLKQVTLEEGAMMLVNPLSVIAFFEIARAGRHRAIVNTVAASALGGMILRLGKRNQIPVIHIVRRQEQADLVYSRGGEYVLNSSNADFVEQLWHTAQKLKATLLLDAIGGDMTQQLADAAPFGSTILLYSRMSHKSSLIDPSIALNKDLHIHGWFLPNWLRKKNLIQVLLLSHRVQTLLATDLISPIAKRLPLSAAQQAVEEYTRNMTKGKILLVPNLSVVAIDG